MATNKSEQYNTESTIQSLELYQRLRQLSICWFFPFINNYSNELPWTTFFHNLFIYPCKTAQIKRSNQQTLNEKSLDGIWYCRSSLLYWDSSGSSLSGMRISKFSLEMSNSDWRFNGLRKLYIMIRVPVSDLIFLNSLSIFSVEFIIEYFRMASNDFWSSLFSSSIKWKNVQLLIF